VQTYDPVRLEEADKRPALLEDGGVYLITGGIGNIGLVLAEAIARDVKAKLVLTGRSPFPDRGGWDEYLAAHGRDTTSNRIRKLQAIEKLGAEIMAVSADATDRQQMQAVLAAVTQKWGAISGVIHGTANLSPNAFGSIRDIDWASGQSHFGPKDHGLLVLEELLAKSRPQFWVLLSSISAVLGGLGLASYAASNAFLDAEAQRMNADGDGSWISINWDAWDFGPQAAAQNGVITAEFGRQAFRRILAAKAGQVVVAATPLAPRVKQWVRFEAIEQNQKTEPVAAASATPSDNGAGRPAGAGNGAAASHARPQLSTPYVAPRSDMERSIAEIWQHFLGVQPIGINDQFFELGGHSLLAIQLLAQLRETFDVDIPMHRLFEAPTVAELAVSIECDRDAAPDLDKLSADADGNLERALKLVEGLSDADVEALLKETENIPELRADHA
jgi:acyl carrier protein/NAD(P)-dependent dehydrogenase (short-subunit alcohol dehydrogenase family)